jgi:hypothetical protein
LRCLPSRAGSIAGPGGDRRRSSTSVRLEARYPGVDVGKDEVSHAVEEQVVPAVLAETYLPCGSTSAALPDREGVPGDGVEVIDQLQQPCGTARVGWHTATPALIEGDDPASGIGER